MRINPNQTSSLPEAALSTQQLGADATGRAQENNSERKGTPFASAGGYLRTSVPLPRRICCRRSIRQAEPQGTGSRESSIYRFT
jgi:hypothetical protein